jgi:hypothetical protein
MWRISDSSVARSPARSPALAARLQLLAEQGLDALERHRFELEAARVRRQLVGQRDVVTDEDDLEPLDLGLQRQLLHRARDDRVAEEGVDVEEQHQRVAPELLHLGQRLRQFLGVVGVGAERPGTHVGQFELQVVGDAQAAARRPLPHLAVAALRDQAEQGRDTALVMGLDHDDRRARGQQLGQRVDLGGGGHGRAL